MDFHIIIIIILIIIITTTGIAVLNMPQEGSTYDHTPADCCVKQDGKITCSQHKKTLLSYIVKQDALSALEELPFHS